MFSNIIFQKKEQMWSLFEVSFIQFSEREIFVLHNKEMWIKLLSSIFHYTAWKVSRYGVISTPYFPVFDWIQENTNQKELRIWTLSRSAIFLVNLEE